MISDLSLSLRTLLTKGAPEFKELSNAAVVFDRPSDTFKPAQATLSLFLHDIRENLDLRTNERDTRVQNLQYQIGRAPLRVQCGYIVTAWGGAATGDALVLLEQTLLSQAMIVFARNPRIPGSFLAGSLANQQPALPVMLAPGEGLRGTGDFWTAIANKIRPSISLAAIFSLPLGVPPGAAPAVESRTLNIGQTGGVKASSSAIGGRVLAFAAAAGAPDSVIAGATVSLPKLGLTATTDAAGRFVFRNIPAGSHPVHVVSGAKTLDAMLNAPPTSPAPYDLVLK